jgi:phosphoserine phosphatase RsbX
VQIASAKRSFMNDPHCGDTCGHTEWDDKIVLYMIDGLGHGKNAEVAAIAAEEYVLENLDTPLKELFQGCNKAISHTRGVALGIAIVDPAEDNLTFAGINNTRIRVLKAQKRQSFQMTSDTGIVGGGFRMLVPSTVDFGPGDTALMFTDGVSERMDVSQYRDAHRADLDKWAETILDDWERTNDDRTVLICRNNGK